MQSMEKTPAWIAQKGDSLEVNQLILVAGIGRTTAWVSMHARQADGTWGQLVSTPGLIGKHGLGKTREGDGRTPVGCFALDAAFGIAPDPGCAIPYHQVTADDYWSGDPREGYAYNRMVQYAAYPGLDTEASEHLISYTRQYQYCLNIAWNPQCVPGKGSAIFLHCFGSIYPYTGGCVAVPEACMRTIMQHVDPDCRVVIDSLEHLSPETWKRWAYTEETN